MTDKTETAPQIDADAVIYYTDRMTPPLAFAAIHGEREGLITSADLPTDTGDVSAYRTRVHRLLKERGVLDSYLASVMQGASAARCPWWCWGQHKEVLTAMDAVFHEALTRRVHFDNHETRDELDPRSVRVAVSAWQGGGGDEVDPPRISLSGSVDVDLGEDDARALAAALTAAADRLAEIRHAEAATLAEQPA